MTTALWMNVFAVMVTAGLDTSPAMLGSIDVKAPPYSAVGDGVTDDTEAIQSAWEAAKATGARVLVPAGDYRISLRGNAEDGYRPALHFSANSASKEKQPILEGATRGVTFVIRFPADAPRTLETIRVDKGTLTDNPRGMSISNLRLVNDGASAPANWHEPYDFRGTGIRIENAWASPLLSNFQILGFCIGLYVSNGYHSDFGPGEIRDCNFGLYLGGTPNASRFHSIVLHKIRPVATNTEGWRQTNFPQGRIGAAVYAGGGTITGGSFDNVNTELCSVAGYFFHSAPHSLTVNAMRSESVFAPIWIYGPVDPFYTTGCTFIGASIDCDSLIVPAVYLNRAEGYTFINTRFYQRNNEGGSRVAIEMTGASRGNLFISPIDDESGTTGKLADDIIDAGDRKSTRLNSSH